MVGGLDDGIALSGQGLDLLQYPQLIAKVQIGGGLVQHQNGGILGKSPGNHYKPLFAP